MPHTHGARRIYQPLSELLAHLTRAEAPKQCEHTLQLCSSELSCEVSHADAAPLHFCLYCMTLVFCVLRVF